VYFAEVRTAAAALVEATHLARGALASWQAEAIPSIQRALHAVADLGDDFDPRSDAPPAHTRDEAYRRWTPLPRDASARDRVHDLYDAASDFLSVFYERDDARPRQCADGPAPATSCAGSSCSNLNAERRPSRCPDQPVLCVLTWRADAVDVGESSSRLERRVVGTRGREYRTEPTGGNL
jgi:hypothetical protein